MNKQQDNIFNGKRIMRDGKLVYINSGIQAKYEKFISGLKEGQIVLEFLEANQDNGTSLQLAKIHVFARKIALHTGMTFTEVKQELKDRAGLQYGNFTKSFADCSVDELGLTLEAIKELCELLEIPYS